MAMVIRKGDKGKAVREIQGLLNSRAGKIVLNPDGDFGGKTETFVKEFQTKMKLKADGVVGPKTWQALHNEALKSQFDNCFTVHDWFSLTDLQKFFNGLAPNSSQNKNSQNPKPSTPKAQLGKTSDTPKSTDIISAPAIVKQTDFKNYRRISFHGYIGQGYVIKDFRKFEGGAIQLIPEIKIIQSDDRLPGGFRNECASYVQYFGVPNTKTWLRGPRVCDFKPGELPEGIVVATLRDGKYYSDYSGRSHVGIYLSHDDYSTYLETKSKISGVNLLDQWNGVKIAKRGKAYSVEADELGSNLTKPWSDSKGVGRNKRVKWGSDGEEYYVLLTTC
ncbi:MAG: peptidoglycan-binding protein [Gammaproteobacteria bacterium]|nr:MAG: peptidoglycan-binding protein [Gammaproteobacteria bacterium]